MAANTLQLKGETLFTSSDAPPFFWLGLLDDTLVSQSCAGNISVTRPIFERNARRTRDFLEETCHDAMPMFMDFVRFLRARYRRGEALVLELPILCEEEGRAQVRQELTAVTEGRVEDLVFFHPEDSPHLACGRPMNASFPNFSTNYRELTRVKPGTEPAKFSLSELIQYCVLLLLCPVMTVMVVRGLLANGFSFMTFFMAFGNVIFYIYSVMHIREQWRCYQSKNENPKEE